MERAAESYSKVVDLAPLHLDARISLSILQQQLGRPEKALEALEPMYDPDTLAQDANAAQQVGRAAGRPRSRSATQQVGHATGAVRQVGHVAGASCLARTA